MKFLLFSSCEGSPFPPGDVLRLHSFLIAQEKQAHPGAETKEEGQKSVASLQMLKMEKGGDVPISACW